MIRLLALASVLLLAIGCSRKANEGEPCAKPEDCTQGLTCAPDPRQGRVFDPTGLRCLSPRALKDLISAATAAAPAINSPALNAARATAARRTLENLSNAVEMFQLDVGRFPSMTEGLEVLRKEPANATGWAGPYLRDTVPLDPWGRQFAYRSPGDAGAKFEIRSLGANGSLGGDGADSDIIISK